LDTARVPKLCGYDSELGNFKVGRGVRGCTCHETAYALLRETKGVSRVRNAAPESSYSYSYRPEPCCERNPGEYRGDDRDYYGQIRVTSGGEEGGYMSRDWGRKFLAPNGGCVYIDLGHLELCTPEVPSARKLVAAWHAMLRIARQAQTNANEKLPPDEKYVVLINNSDGQNSYGSHLNVLLTQRAWENIFDRKPHYASFLASYQVSSIVNTGQGKVGSENGTAPVPYQVTQRADFNKTVMGLRTTFDRPLLNTRNEPLCGRRQTADASANEADKLARLHVIFYDNNLCEVSNYLKVGGLQIVLAMIEAEWVNPKLLLDDPVSAAIHWSHDPSLQSREPLISGKKVTAVELQELFLEEATDFVDAGGCDGIVPDARHILHFWKDTLAKLKAGDLAALARRLDWVLKLSIIQRAMQLNPELTWDSPEIKQLDYLYSSLDSDEGLYWIYERSGFVERIVSDAEIERFVHEPPTDTRAWTRAMLLRKAGEAVDDVDWDYVTVKCKGRQGWPVYRTIDLANPLAFTKAQAEHIFQEDNSLEEVLDALGAQADAGAANNVAGQQSEGRCLSRPAAACPVTNAVVASDCEPQANDQQLRDDTDNQKGVEDHEISGAS
jgi:hypothetical protein